MKKWMADSSKMGSQKAWHQKDINQWHRKRTTR